MILHLLLVSMLLDVEGGELENVPRAVTEYCDTEVFTPSCAENEVVFMKTAKYGRMRLGRCVEIDLGYLGCYTDVLDVLDRLCSGQRSCEVRVPDADLEATRPCLKELKTYLEANYSCVPVVTEAPETCTSANHVNITSSSGWIGSVVTIETGCGSIHHPWIIRALPGQQINLTLYDFWREHSYTSNEVIDDGIETHICKEYAHVREINTDWNSIICGGGRRVDHVYLSKTNSVELQITNKDTKYFLIHYEAIGCPNMEPPAHGFFERDDTGAVIGCRFSDLRWHVTCSGTLWMGYVGNCSAPALLSDERGGAFNISLPLGASIAIIIGAAVGVGLVVIAIGLLRFKGLFFFKRREYERPPSTASHAITVGPLGTSGETILLREKSPPASESGQADSGHCSLEPTEGTAIASSPPPPHMVHHHQRLVKINGNEYAHIWESPLPDPRNSANFTPCRLCPHDPRDPRSRNVNTVYMLRCSKPGEKPAVCEAVHTMKPFRKESLQNAQNSGACTSSCEAPRYSSLERKTVYGNSSSSV